MHPADSTPERRAHPLRFTRVRDRETQDRCAPIAHLSWILGILNFLRFHSRAQTVKTLQLGEWGEDEGRNTSWKGKGGAGTILFRRPSVDGKPRPRKQNPSTSQLKTSAGRILRSVGLSPLPFPLLPLLYHYATPFLSSLPPPLSPSSSFDGFLTVQYFRCQTLGISLPSPSPSIRSLKIPTYQNLNADAVGNPLPPASSNTRPHSGSLSGLRPRPNSCLQD